MIDVIQGSEEWFQLRCGRATASEFGSILAKGQGKTRATYMHRVIAERLTGKPVETYRGPHMDRGIEQEPLARIAYEARSDNFVLPGGFFTHPAIMAGASPDGLVGDVGGVELKSVIATVQVQTLLRGGYPPEHKPQVQGNLWITGRQWWDFVSFCQDMPARRRCYIFRVHRDETYIAELEQEVRKFLEDVDDAIARLGVSDLEKVAA